MTVIGFNFTAYRNHETIGAKTMIQRKTNVEFITDLLEYSNFGALSQLFIIEAIRYYADEVAAADVVVDTGLISGETWQLIALEIKRKMDERLYNR